MSEIEISRDGSTDDYSIVMVQGTDTVRCMVSISGGGGTNVRSDDDKRLAALRKAKELADAFSAILGRS